MSGARYVGNLTLGGCLPSALTAQGTITAAVGVSLPQAQARLTGALAAQLRVAANPPTLATQLSAAQSIVASLQAAITLGLPVVSIQASALAALVLQLEGIVGDLQAQLAFGAALGVTLGTAGVHMYTRTGAASGFAADMAALTADGFGGSGAGADSAAIVFAATTSAARVALGSFCGVTLWLT